ncbi:hypothetical protein JCM10212_003352 [Sporobolomyces blumeae]
MTPARPPAAPAPAAPDLEDELAAFRREWQEETKRRVPTATTASPSRPPNPTVPTSPKSKRKSGDHGTVHDAADQLEQLKIREDQTRVEPEIAHPPFVERERPKSALELYDEAVKSEREGRLNDALIAYRASFRLDPDVDRVWNRAATARAASSTTRSSLDPSNANPSNEWRFERTVQLGPDYEAANEHRTKEEAHLETGGKTDVDSTHPSSTSFLVHSLLKSIAENPFERKQRNQVSSRSGEGGDDEQDEPTPPPPPPERPRITPDEALATLHFVAADEEKPLPLANLPREVLLLILRNLVLSPVLPPPKSRDPHEDPTAPQTGGGGIRGGKRNLKKRTPKEEMQILEIELELEQVDREWKSDVEALERFARVCRAARIVTLDSALWRALCHRTYTTPHQIAPAESPASLVQTHGNDWRRFFVEHPRIRLDGCYISVVTYLRRGEVTSVYAPTTLITFFRYFRFYHHGLVISLLSTDPPNSVVRRLNPALRIPGLTFGRWRLRGDLVEMQGLEDPNVPEQKRKYSFRMTCRLKSSARGRMNKLDLIAMATERRETLEVEPLPLRPNKPYYFSKVALYAHDNV